MSSELICTTRKEGFSVIGNTLTTLDAVLTGRKTGYMVRQGSYNIRELQGMPGLSCPQSIYRWISGQAMYSIDNLYMLSRIFEMHMEDLLVPMDSGRDSG